VKFPHVYSPDQFARAAQAWSALLAVQVVSISADSGHPRPCGLTDEELWELIWSDGQATDDVDSRTISLFSWSDYGGTPADVANARYLTAEDSPFHLWVGFWHGSHGAGSAWVQCGELSAADIDTGLDQLDALVAVMAGTETDGVLCENTLDAYLTELATEAWQAWLRLDVPGEIATLIDTEHIPIPQVLLDHGHPVETARDYADWLWGWREERFATAYYAYPDNQWVFEPNAPTHVINHAHADAVRHAARIAFGWSPPTAADGTGRQWAGA
jgi:hypothetical protein